MSFKFAGFDCVVRREMYVNGDDNIGLRLVDPVDGSPIATATSWIPGLASDEVAIKDYSENSGMYQTLLDAGIIEPYHRTASINLITLFVCRLKG